MTQIRSEWTILGRKLASLGMVAALLAAMTTPALLSQSKPPPRPKAAPVVSSVGRQARLEDPEASSASHRPGDARAFEAKVVEDRVECVLEMARPLIEGMFTMVELWIDCDDKPATGLDGREFRVRAAVGSRFQPSSAEPENGELSPIDHIRISATGLSKGEQGGISWLHRAIEADAPQVSGNKLTFWFPRKVLRESGDRYHGRVAMRVVVETSNSDQPIEMMHVCSDEGIPIRIDGSAADWSARRVLDPAGELHPIARCIDITGLRVEHGKDSLLACLEFAQPGFSDWAPDSDVMGFPVVTFLVEPMFPRYMNPYEVQVMGSLHDGTGVIPQGSWSFATGPSVLEVVVPRVQGQNKLRLIAVSDLILHDEFDTELRIDTEAK